MMRTMETSAASFQVYFSRMKRTARLARPSFIPGIPAKNGEVYGTYSLAKDQVIRINDTNVCEIKNGEIHMTDANCPDHLCMKQKAVDSTGGTIVCLPNKVVIEGEKGESSEDDSPEFDTVV